MIKIAFLNSILFLGLLCSISPIYSIPIEVIPSSGIVYPIHVACECDYNLYVDGKKVNPVGIVTSWDRTDDGVNVTNIFNPVLFAAVELPINDSYPIAVFPVDLPVVLSSA